MTGVEPGLRGPDAAAVIFPGDVNCSGATDVIDSLQILTFAVGASTTTDCLQQHGNVNCDASIDAADSVLDLRYAAGLPIDLMQSCPAIGGPPTAEAMTRALNAATTADDADWVLKLIYQQIGVGVYTGDGQQILAGNETGLDDFYLYDFESALLAGNYVDQQLFGLDTAALFLNKAGVPNPGGAQPWTNADVLSVLATKVAAGRGDSSLIAWRLIDELGLEREEPLDLTQADLDPEATFLDSIQTFLLLNDLTSGLPASAGVSSEDVGAAATPSARTRTLHVYSLTAQSYEVNVFIITPTHWKHDRSSTAEERTLTTSITYNPAIDDLAPLAGPLAGLGFNEALGTLNGRPVAWTSKTLVPKNGTWKDLANTHFTDSDGVTSVVFVPKTECAPGKGSLKTETHQVNVAITTLIGDLFAPNNGTQDRVTLQAQNEIEVSRHTGKAAKPSGGVGIEGITSLADLPCEWAGTAHADILNHPRLFEFNFIEIGDIDGTFTFGNPQLQPGGNEVRYEITEGSATWFALVSCEPGADRDIYQFSGTEEVAGELIVSDDGSGNLKYHGIGTTVGQNLSTPCGATFTLETNTFFNTCADPMPLTGLELSDHCTIPDPDFSDAQRDDKYNWDLIGVPCSAAAGVPSATAVTPEGICGGP
jgi:hypothetical protein